MCSPPHWFNDFSNWNWFERLKSETISRILFPFVYFICSCLADKCRRFTFIGIFVCLTTALRQLKQYEVEKWSSTEFKVDDRKVLIFFSLVSIVQRRRQRNLMTCYRLESKEKNTRKRKLFCQSRTTSMRSRLWLQSLFLKTKNMANEKEIEKTNKSRNVKTPFPMSGEKEREYR